MTTHSTHIEPPSTQPGPFRWVCTCGERGRLHREHQIALEFALDHLKLTRPYVEDAR